jgi:hypothetical protein
LRKESGQVTLAEEQIAQEKGVTFSIFDALTRPGVTSVGYLANGYPANGYLLLPAIYCYLMLRENWPGSPGREHLLKIKKVRIRYEWHLLKDKDTINQ